MMKIGTALNMSECSIQLHVRIIYVILLINISICTVCLYFLINSQSDGNNNNVGLSNYYITAESVEDDPKRAKRDFSGLQADVSLVKQCEKVVDLCYGYNTAYNNYKYLIRSKRNSDLRGPPGPAGPPGKQGHQGLKGSKGEKGEKGHQGLLGFPGYTGDKGLKGETGDKGSSGLVGPPGRVGPKGPRGAKGAKGEVGPKGQPGRPGNNGTTGQPGRRGLTGPHGFPGSKGEKGGQHTFPYVTGNCTCSRSEKGEKGSRGQLGYTGFKGDKGERGDKGRSGNGQRGIPGATENHSYKGSKGEKGTKGEAVVYQSDDMGKLKNIRQLFPATKRPERAPWYDEEQEKKNCALSNTPQKSMVILPLVIVMQIGL